VCSRPPAVVGIVVWGVTWSRTQGGGGMPCLGWVRWFLRLRLCRLRGLFDNSAAPLGTRGVVPSDLKTQEIKRSIGGVIYIYGFLARLSAPYMLGFFEDDFAVFVST